MNKPQAVNCRSCSALMFWAVTVNKKNMPIDMKPDPSGGFVVTLKGDGKLYAETYSPNEPKHQGRNRYTSHFSTCPNAGAHRHG